MVAIRPRSAWGAKFSNGAGPASLPATDGAFLHHSDGKAKDGPGVVLDLERVGQERFKAGISYTFAISPDGTIWEGHSIDRRGSHTKDHNTKGRGIVLMGVYSQTAPSREQKEAVAQLLAHGVRHAWWPSTRLRGHREVRATECPGEAAFGTIPGIVARADALLGGGAPVEPDGPPTRKELKKGDDGGDVKFLQGLLNIITPKAQLGDRKPLDTDGDFGARTAARVKEFQVWANGVRRLAGATTDFLPEDGVCGPDTLAAVAFWVPAFS
ncbi:MAG TPA: N-acetylmuramoyl-L-alanine amidase [Iamia sp.]|nr:N-acetylmuramoyl-L-alanine amidase [Iamia sp.]